MAPLRKILVPLVLALVLISLASCGGDDETASTSGRSDTTAAAEADPEKLTLYDDEIFDSTVRYAADPSGDLSFLLTEASASPGRDTFEFVNPQSVPHDVAIEDRNGRTIAKTKKIKEGKTTIAITVKPGVYVLYCTVPGHRKAGMIGHLTVH
jgi:plastocyanin